jgi:uncharacterized RDD family membrane protein YckC
MDDSQEAPTVDYASGSSADRDILGLRHQAYAVDFGLWSLLGRAIFRWSGFGDWVRLHFTDTAYWVIGAVMLFSWRFLFLLKDGFSGYSPGKWSMGIRVVTLDRGEQVGFAKSLRRNLPLLLPFIGEFWVWLGMRSGHRPFDAWARTRVTKASDD